MPRAEAICMDFIYEDGRDIAVVADHDVVVCGGGPAGVAAAVSAARAGADTALIEMHGCLGGVWTAGLLAWILDSGDKSGLLPEILSRLEARRARQPMHWGGIAFDPEEMKLLLEEICAEAGVHIRLHTRVAAAIRNGRELVAAVTESKSGREAWRATVFVDATGDGDLAARAGCGFDYGRPGNAERPEAQPMSLLALLGGVRYEEIRPFVHEEGTPWRDDSRRLLETLARHGVVPTYGAPVLFRIYDDLYALMANHAYGVCGLDADDLTRATIKSRAELHQVVKALRAAGEPWSGLKVVATGAQIGVREGRRIHGRYTVTTDDLRAGARHEDAVCRVSFPVDIHSTNQERSKSYGNDGVRAQPYDIPLRALIARDVDGLLMAGRCISGDFVAHSSYRVTGNAVAMGEAAGKVAAWSARNDLPPHTVTLREALLQGREEITA